MISGDTGSDWSIDTDMTLTQSSNNNAQTSLASDSQPDLSLVLEPVAAFETYLATILEARELPANLREAAQYSLLGPGKRIRPVLTIRACQLLGQPAEKAYPAAAAIEMIHCFSLVHDDLPAMDDDDLRRGRPTLHRHTNEAMAILAGDLLLGMAFEHVSCAYPEDQTALKVAILQELAVANNNMIAGQIYDTLPAFPDGFSGEDKLKTIHINKTGALIRCACRMGALCGGADEAQLERITRYAESVGLMFQVVDDILDVTQTTEHLGKTAGKDSDQGKLTYPEVMGLEKAHQKVLELKAEADASLAYFDNLAAESGGKSAVQALRELCQYLAVRTR